MTSPPPNAPMPPPPAPQPPMPPMPPGQFYAPPAAPPKKPGTNGFAVAALIFGVLGLLPLAIIFGIVALVRIRRQPQAGKVIAIIGMVLPTVTLVVSIAIAIAVQFASDSDSVASGANGQVSVDEIKIRDCLNGLTEGRSIENLPVVPCSEPHDGEVFAEFPISGAAFPGDAAVTTQAEAGCVERLRNFAPKAAEDPNTQLYYLHPTAASWLTGDRDVLCVALSASGKRTGSIFD